MSRPLSAFAIVFFLVGLLTLASVVILGAYNSSVATEARDKTTSLLHVAVVPGSCNVASDTAVPLELEYQRRYDAYKIRHDRALAHLTEIPLPCHPNNGDEVAYGASQHFFAQFTKGMQHDPVTGLLSDTQAYENLLHAVNGGGVPADFDAITQATGAVRDFTNPQAAFAFTLEGADSHTFQVPPAPAFSSAERAANIVENYWMALLRDVRFDEYATHPLAAQAAADLSGLSDYRGPPVSAQHLFRCTAPGCLVGPYISQFMYQPTAFGSTTIDLSQDVPTPGRDFLATNYTEFIRVQNGEQPAETMSYVPSLKRYIITGRDLAQFVWKDVLFQAYFTAMLQLLKMGALLKPNIPYQTTELNQMGFGTFGPPHIAYLATGSSMLALKAAWFQKWAVHRTLRPEAMASRIHLHKTGVQTFPIHADALNSAALTEVFNRFGTYLLPIAFPEGSPLHPSYCAGHATVAGAAVTLLKALFQEDWVIPSPVVPDSVDGTTLVPLVGGPALTVGGELNKLAANIGIGRNIAGVHFMSDHYASIDLGEQVAISILRDMKATFNEPFTGFTFTDFKGNNVFV